METEELLETARQLVELGTKRGVTLRILGHLAVRHHVEAHRELLDLLKRVPTHDIDFIGYSREQNQTNRMFIEELGYKPDPAVAYSQEFGIKRLIYHHDNGIMAEIFLDELRMAHTLDFRDRLELDSPTISLIDLLLSKLQIQQINEKDIKDMIVLLSEHQLGAGDRELIDIDYLNELTSDDWGLYFTAHKNLVRTYDFLGHYEVLDSKIRENVAAKVNEIMNSMKVKPKSLRWKMRAKIGTRAKWYEDVGDVHR
jgi:hypothetical protein